MVERHRGLEVSGGPVCVGRVGRQTQKSGERVFFLAASIQSFGLAWFGAPTTLLPPAPRKAHGEARQAKAKQRRVQVRSEIDVMKLHLEPNTPKGRHPLLYIQSHTLDLSQ